MLTANTEFVDMLNEMRYGELSDRSIKRFESLSRDILYEDGIQPTELCVSFIICMSLVSNDVPAFLAVKMSKVLIRFVSAASVATVVHSKRRTVALRQMSSVADYLITSWLLKNSF